MLVDEAAAQACVPASSRFLPVSSSIRHPFQAMRVLDFFRTMTIVRVITVGRVVSIVVRFIRVIGGFIQTILNLFGEGS